MPPLRQKEGIPPLPKPTVLTLVLASQTNLLWIPKFLRVAEGEGKSGVDGARGRPGGVCAKKSVRVFYLDADFVFTGSL